ncbi:MAG TPA: glycoside hydrolase family 57 [Nitrospirae bacterium]|nr:glycoside hydrolase family 57 [Nitrospirota bacterium]
MTVSVKDKLDLYFITHLNLMYSSIHEEDHSIVINKCYWPLLEMCEEYRMPMGIEISAYTLERISELDSAWISKLKDLCMSGLCEILGSGYSQMIGPLIPQKVNKKNLEIGLAVYDEMLDVRPKIAYVNEQAFSAGMVDVYIESGFDAIFMEWNNVYSNNKELWESGWQYYPQYAVSAEGHKIPVIWNNAVSFQRLQRYVHGEISGEEYSKYLESHRGPRERYLCMYGSDAEIFDFRPGRYNTEVVIEQESEWKRFGIFIEGLINSGLHSFVLPSDTLMTSDKEAFNELRLSTAASPVPVKKQSKYNITRWALTGRDDVRNNGTCYKLYSMLESLLDDKSCPSDEFNEYWKELCYLWGSDFRTHITDEKYTDFIKRQGILEYKLVNSQWSMVNGQKTETTTKDQQLTTNNQRLLNEQYLTVETPKVKITVNNRRGMAIDSLIFKEIGETSLIGTLHQGYFNDMTWGVDLYSGHVIVQPIGQPKITDLEKVEIMDKKSGVRSQKSEVRTLSCSVRTSFGIIYKTIYIFEDKPKIEIEYVFEWSGLKDASFHAGIVTLNPEAFDEDTLYYATHNGGPEEKYYLKGHEFNHSQPVAQSMISATHCLGATEGIVKIGDKDKTLIIRADKYPVSAQPMLEFHKVDDKYLLRLYHSLGEHDETSYWMFKGRTNWKMSVELEK